MPITDIIVNKSTGGARHDTLMKGFNLRWPPTEAEGASNIYICRTEQEIEDALGHAVEALAGGKGRPVPDKSSAVASKEMSDRITVRSGGHCYEGFVSNNKNGSIIDIGLVAGLLEGDQAKVSCSTDGIIGPGKAGSSYTYGFKLLAGTQNWNGAVELFKRHGKLIPGGSCYSVAAGGHICGGGYGFNSRKSGLTIDYVCGVDILVVTKDGEVIKRHANAFVNSDLFAACRGAGGGSFGIITAYYFELNTANLTAEQKQKDYKPRSLPPAPTAVAIMMLNIPWSQFQDGGEFEKLEEEIEPEGFKKFKGLLERYGSYWSDAARGKDPKTWGLFSILKLTHSSSGNLKLNLQYHDNDGKLADPKTLQDFLDYVFNNDVIVTENGKPVTKDGKPVTSRADKNLLPIKYKHAEHHAGGIVSGATPKKVANLPNEAYVLDWLSATQTFNGVAANQRSKYKSSYMKKTFTATAIKAFWNHLTVAATTTEKDKDGKPIELDMSQLFIQADSYGGAINEFALPKDSSYSKLDADNQFSERSSSVKVQYILFWQSDEDDKEYCGWLKKLYEDVHSDQIGNTPYPFKKDTAPMVENPDYAGCYINYPDVDMTDALKLPVDLNKIDTEPNWGVLYYGVKGFKKLMETKAIYDPANVFRHKMSIPVWPAKP